MRRQEGGTQREGHGTAEAGTGAVQPLAEAPQVSPAASRSWRTARRGSPHSSQKGQAPRTG